MRFLNECKTRSRNIISSFLSKQANLLHHSLVLELISFWIICSDCLVRWFWVRKSSRSHSASGWRKGKTIWGMLYTSSRLYFGRIGSAVWGNRWVFGNDKKRNILNLLLISVGKSVSVDFPFSLQIVRLHCRLHRLAASGYFLAFGLLIVENTSREQQCVLILKWLNTAVLPDLQMR